MTLLPGEPWGTPLPAPLSPGSRVVPAQWPCPHSLGQSLYCESPGQPSPICEVGCGLTSLGSLMMLTCQDSQGLEWLLVP